MADTAPSYDEYERVDATTSPAPSKSIEPDAALLRQAIEAELADVPGGTRARAQLFADVDALPAMQREMLTAVIQMSEDADDALAAALQVLVPELDLMAQVALVEAFSTNELLRRQWEFAYRTLNEPEPRA